MCEAPSGKRFHTGQIYVARYPITPLFASKLVNFCTYFRHLCIIEKRRPLLSLLTTVVDIGLLPVSEALQCTHRDARPTDRYLQGLRACTIDSAIFAKFFRTFWSLIPLGGVPGRKFLHQKFCLTMGNMFHTTAPA